MTWRVYVRPDIVMDGVAISAAEFANGTRIGRALAPMELTQVDLDESIVSPIALRIPDDLGRALYEALSTHYGGAPASQTQRADFVHERGRVDKLLAWITDGPAPLDGR